MLLLLQKKVICVELRERGRCVKREVATFEAKPRAEVRIRMRGGVRRVRAREAGSILYSLDTDYGVAISAVFIELVFLEHDEPGPIDIAFTALLRMLPSFIQSLSDGLQLEHCRDMALFSLREIIEVDRLDSENLAGIFIGLYDIGNLDLAVIAEQMLQHFALGWITISPGILDGLLRDH